MTRKIRNYGQYVRTISESLLVKNKTTEVTLDVVIDEIQRVSGGSWPTSLITQEQKKKFIYEVFRQAYRDWQSNCYVKNGVLYFRGN